MVIITLINLKYMKSEYGKFANAKTNSEGFCFVGENVTIDDLNGNIELVSYKNAIEKIFGIMGRFNGLILVEFEVVDGLDIKERLW